MNQFRLKSPYASATIYLILTLIIGMCVVLLPLNGIEGNAVFDLQNYVQKTIGIQAFQVLTYPGDFYLWVILGSIYMLIAYLKLRKQLGSALKLATFLVITTALTYPVKMVFARPRPNYPGLKAYDSDILSSYSYPSGHVSRATGAFLILSTGSRTKESLAAIAISIVSLSRIVLGAHYLTDVVGGVFLSLAAQRLAYISVPLLRHKMETSPK
jgi:membrane-associated phospholipid phosphatase